MLSNEMTGTTPRYRWTICALVFFATTINYIDRQVISLLKEDYLAPTFNWTEDDYANMVIAFKLAYALGMLLAGTLVDRLGTRTGYSVILIVWSLASMLHAFTRSNFAFVAVRSVLGLSEAGNFPVAIKTTAEWFPKKERALAAGFFNAGTSIGPILAPLSVFFVAEWLGWQWAFIITGGLGFIWLIFWLKIYEVPQRHKKLSKEELDYINADEDEKDELTLTEKVSWYKLLQYRQTWVFIMGKFFSDPVWWFYFFWLPSFLKSSFGMEKTGLALPVALIYLISMVGSFYGGWVSSNLIKKGWPVYKARKAALLIFAVMAVPVVLAQALSTVNPWITVVMLGIATAAHQGWSANLFTLTSDMFPKKVVASVVGIGGMAGAFGGIFIAKLAGKLLDYYELAGNINLGYYILFGICGAAYLVALTVMHFCSPRMERVRV